VPSPAPERPPAQGLRFWLDAAEESSIAVGAEGAVIRWNDRTAAKSTATPVGNGRIVLVRDAVHGLPAIKFEGPGGFFAPGLGTDVCDVVAFVVFRQSKDQASRNPAHGRVPTVGSAEPGWLGPVWADD
jgi:hypothetical protein